jgi:hypothetical protein
VGAALGVSVGVEAISKVTVAGYEEPEGGGGGCLVVASKSPSRM